jgi:hypothetical protein
MKTAEVRLCVLSVKESDLAKPLHSPSKAPIAVCLLGKSPRDAYLISMLNLTDNSHDGNKLGIGSWQQGLAAAEVYMFVMLGADKLHCGGADNPRGKV